MTEKDAVGEQPSPTKSDSQEAREAANIVWELAKNYSFATRSLLKAASTMLHEEAYLLERKGQ